MITGVNWKQLEKDVENCNMQYDIMLKLEEELDHITDASNIFSDLDSIINTYSEYPLTYYVSELDSSSNEFCGYISLETNGLPVILAFEQTKE